MSLLLLFSGLGTTTSGSTPLAFALDINSRILIYLRDLYTAPTGDYVTLVDRYLDSQTGDYDTRLKKLVQAATDATI